MGIGTRYVIWLLESRIVAAPHALPPRPVARIAARASAFALEFAPTTCAVVGDNLFDHARKRGRVDRFPWRTATVRAIVLVCPPVMMPSGSGTMAPS